jgi:uncharacterized protein YciI
VRTSLLLILLTFPFAFGQSQPPEAEKTTFIVIYKPGAGWLPGKPLSQQPLGGHGKFMLDLYTSKALKFAGPFSDDAGGAAVFEAASASEAAAIIAKDPAVASKVFSAEVHPWRLVQWEKIAGK